MTILFGGSSYEHEISIVSAITVGKIINPTHYIFMDSHRRFYLIEHDNLKATYFSSKEYKKSKELVLTADGFFVRWLLGLKPLQCNTVINLIHGRDGEDGKISSLLEYANLPYIGPRLEASVLSYNKLLTKLYAQDIGVKTLDYTVVDKNSKDVAMDFPLIIKPLRLGSSIGVSIAKDRSQLEFALDVAFEFDTHALVEPFIEGIKEYNLAGCKAGSMIYSMVEEPQKSEILDFDKKYLDFSRDAQVTKADISPQLQQKLMDGFEKVYGSMFAGSLIRCDFFVHQDCVYLNEINPIPGSMANYLFDDFTGAIHALAKHLPQEQKIAIDYNYIDNIKGSKSKA